MKILTAIFLVLYLGGCKDENSPNPLSGDWTIDTNYLRQGCFSGKDCIPSLEHPGKSIIGDNNLSFLDDNDLVVGSWDGNDYIAYPHSILDWHEIVNENGYSISYCPLTGSALHINTDSEFGVSGLLYNSNLIMYDRNSESHWPQMLLQSAEGSRQGDELTLNSMIETTWATWKKLFPETKILNSATGYSRDYNSYPYGSYKTCNSASCGDYIYFPVSVVDNRLPAKTRVLSIISNTTKKSYPIQNFIQPTIINETIDGVQFAVILSADEKIGVAFKTELNLSIETWDIGTGTILLADANGNQWNILGRLINGNMNDLVPAKSFISYWFSQAAFYPETEIHS